MTKYYAGVGSRQTPADIIALMPVIAQTLSQDKWILRSGHADGADLAFETGAQNNAEIYLPWATFNSQWPTHSQVYTAPTQAAMTVAMNHHPRWNSLSQGARRLHARNSHQILGPDLNDPVKFVICWTPDGADGSEAYPVTMDTGGTGQAIRLAHFKKIPVFNLQQDAHRERLERYVRGVSAP